MELLDEIKLAYNVSMSRNISLDWNLSESLPLVLINARKRRRI